MHMNYFLHSFSGSYDHTVKMYDSRRSKSVFTVKHGHPVESVLLYPTGGIFISAGKVPGEIWQVP